MLSTLRVFLAVWQLCDIVVHLIFTDVWLIWLAISLMLDNRLTIPTSSGF